MRWQALRRPVLRHGRRWRATWRAYRMPPGLDWPRPALSPIVAGLSPDAQRRAISEACQTIGAVPEGDAHTSVRQTSIGVKLCRTDGTANWLKISEKGGLREQWRRQGERLAQAVEGISQPRILRELEWSLEGSELHAFVYSLAPSPSGQTTPWISSAMPAIGDDWLRELGSVFARLAAEPLSRWLIHPGPIARIIAERFGRKAPYDIAEWRMAHGDLNWSNVTAPTLSLLDWEFYGAAPRGYDAAMLLLFSARDPELYRRMEAAFADDLNTSSGIAARLYLIARSLDNIERGNGDPRRHAPLEREAKRLLRM